MSTDLREEILRQEYEKYFAAPKWDGSPTKATNINWMKNALDEYWRVKSMELLEYMADNNVSCEMDYPEDKDGVPVFKFKGEWITAKQLFENFL